MLPTKVIQKSLISRSSPSLANVPKRMISIDLNHAKVKSFAGFPAVIQQFDKLLEKDSKGIKDDLNDGDGGVEGYLQFLIKKNFRLQNKDAENINLLREQPLYDLSEHVNSKSLRNDDSDGKVDFVEIPHKNAQPEKGKHLISNLVELKVGYVKSKGWGQIVVDKKDVVVDQKGKILSHPSLPMGTKVVVKSSTASDDPTEQNVYVRPRMLSEDFPKAELPLNQQGKALTYGTEVARWFVGITPHRKDLEGDWKDYGGKMWYKEYPDGIFMLMAKLGSESASDSEGDARKEEKAVKTTLGSDKSSLDASASHAREFKL